MRSSRYEARGKFGEHERCVRVARGVALLNLSVEPVMSSGEQIKLLKMSYNPNCGEVLKLSTVFRKNGLGISIL